MDFRWKKGYNILSHAILCSKPTYPTEAGQKLSYALWYYYALERHVHNKIINNTYDSPLKSTLVYMLILLGFYD